MEASFASSILLNAPMAVVAINGVGTIRSFNTRADVLFGLSQTMTGCIAIQALLPEFDVRDLTSGPGLEAFNARSRIGGDAHHMKAIRRDGVQAFVDVQAARFSANGEDFLTLFLQDVTAVVAAEAAVHELKQQIIYNWRLNSLGEMASMVAHELNQPLSAILNFLDAAKTLIGRPELDRPKVLKFIESAEVQAERASDVIRRLKTLMSRDSGFHAKARVSEIVAEIMPILNINAREVDAAIKVRIPADGFALCDRVQVQQVLLNLVRNALDAPVRDQRRRVLISGDQTIEGYRMLVEDNGPGVDDAVTKRLFDPLASTKAGGMGLGLSICRTIVEAHNGSIDHVSSTLGGAGFAFTILERPANV